VLTIGRHCFTNSAVSIWLQQGLHDVFERRPDSAPYVEGFIRFVSKGAQRSKAACKNAGLRINQGAVEVQKNGASHNPNVPAEGNAYKSHGLTSAMGQTAALRLRNPTSG
jgi:hypothetical protein